MQLRELFVFACDRLELLRQVVAVLAPLLRGGAAARRVDSAHLSMARRFVACLLRFHPVVLGHSLMLLRGVGHLYDEMLDVVLLGVR